MSGFTVYPAIDVRGGRCVRLRQGDFGRAKEYDADPVERAREWERQGAQAIHIVDLDGAKEGRPVQIGLIRRIARAVGIPRGAQVFHGAYAPSHLEWDADRPGDTAD